MTTKFKYEGEKGFKDFDLALNKIVPTSEVLEPNKEITIDETKTGMPDLIRRLKINNSWTPVASTGTGGSSGSGSSGSGGD